MFVSRAGPLAEPTTVGLFVGVIVSCGIRGTFLPNVVSVATLSGVLVIVMLSFVFFPAAEFLDGDRYSWSLMSANDGERKSLMQSNVKECVSRLIVGASGRVIAGPKFSCGCGGDCCGIGVGCFASGTTSWLAAVAAGLVVAALLFLLSDWKEYKDEEAVESVDAEDAAEDMDSDEMEERSELKCMTRSESGGCV